MQFKVLNGPIEGLSGLEFSPKRIPVAIQCCLRGCGAAGYRVAIYRLQAEKKAFVYEASHYEQQPDVAVLMDVHVKEWLELEGSKKTGGGMWSFWNVDTN